MYDFELPIGMSAVFFLPMIMGYLYVVMLIRIQSSAHPVLKKAGIQAIQAMFLGVSHPHCRGTSTPTVRMVDFSLGVWGYSPV